MGISHSNVSRAGALSCAAVALCAGAPCPAADEVAVTPYRPTVSTPAALSATDWIEVEMGVLGSSGGIPSPRDSAPYAIKLAFSDNWGVRIGGELWVRDLGEKGRNINGIGDTALVLKRRFAVNDRSAFGLEVGVMSPTAPAGLHGGSGGNDYGMNAIYSTDIGAAFHTDLNYSMTRLGLAAAGESRELKLWATALSYAISPQWGLTSELSGTQQTGAASTDQLLLAATYSPYKRITWDFGFVRGMTAATPTWSLLAGCTFLVSQL
jgi:hypothetical protein